MKTRSILITIPNKYKWLAVDEDGSQCIYQKKPEKVEVGQVYGAPYGYWENSGRCGDDYIDLGQIDPPENWQDTLVKLKDVMKGWI